MKATSSQRTHQLHLPTGLWALSDADVMNAARRILFSNISLVISLASYNSADPAALLSAW